MEIKSGVILKKISDLITNSDLLGEYKLNFKYFKILENELNTETLLSIKNIVSTLFLSEIDYDSETLIEEIINLFDNEKDKQAVSLFLNWFRILSENGKIKEDDYKKMETLYKDKGEISSMLVTALKKEKKRLREEAIAEGKAEGRAEGKAKGRSEGKAEILVKILNKKFANVSDSIIVKINSIDDESKLDELIDMVFEINLIDELNL